MKDAYLAYEERNLPIVKEENSTLQLTQLKQIIRKNWNKAPENPLNQPVTTRLLLLLLLAASGAKLSAGEGYLIGHLVSENIGTGERCHEYGGKPRRVGD